MSRSEEFAAGHGHRFEYVYTDWNDAHHVNAYRGDEKVGYMDWAGRRDIRGKITHIATQEEHRRRGVATGMWNTALSAHAADPERVPKPKHSSVRSDAGDAWARSVSKRLPKRRPDE